MEDPGGQLGGFPAAQKWFAVGECKAHADHLEKLGRSAVILRTVSGGTGRRYDISRISTQCMNKCTGFCLRVFRDIHRKIYYNKFHVTLNMESDKRR